ATLECVVGLCLLSGRAVPLAVCLLGMLLVGILSPLVLMTGRLFAGPHGAPTLEGQYVIKDVILVGAALVVAATCRGGRLTAAPDACEERTAADTGFWCQCHPNSGCGG
ncbi:MAG: hypothetical protein QOJ85_3288, partial [Solirubrobacteraceae bacterium]|nr:hypothetical protein [Solirubrobacteraceae bacterium]